MPAAMAISSTTLSNCRSAGMFVPLSTHLPPSIWATVPPPFCNCRILIMLAVKIKRVTAIKTSIKIAGSHHKKELRRIRSAAVSEVVKMFVVKLM